MGFLGLFAFRIQSGDYTITDTGTISERSEYEAESVEVSPELPGYEHIMHGRGETSLVKNWRTTTTGSYGLWGIRESRDYSETIKERDDEVNSYSESLSGTWGESHSHYALDYQNKNGQISGHEYERLWGAADPLIMDPVWFFPVESYDHVTIDEDLFGGMPPSGPKPVGSYVVYSPRDEQAGGEGEGEEGQNGFQPGTIDVDLSADNGHIPLTPRSVVDEVFTESAEEAWERYRLSQLNSLPSNEDWRQSEFERAMREGEQPLKVVGVRQIGSGIGLGSVIYGDDPIATWNPLTWVDAGRRSLFNTAFPPVTPSYELTYEDGSKKIILNGSPTSEGLAGQALLFAPLLKGKISGAKPVTESPAPIKQPKGVTNPEIQKLKIDASYYPPGVTNNEQFGQGIMKWGYGEADTIEAIGKLTKEQLKAGGVTKEIAKKWLKFYENEFARNQHNLTAKYRIQLMQKAAKLLDE